MTKLKVLIVDDVSDHCQNSIVQLISYDGEGEYRNERIALAKEYFTIEAIEIVGKAIDMVKDGFIPDLAIIDVDFSLKDEKDILREGYDPEIEKSTTRGLDLLEYLNDTVTVVYTGNKDSVEIIREIKKRNKVFGDDFYFKGDKGSLGMVFNSSMPYLLQSAAKGILVKLSKQQRKEVKRIINGLNDVHSLLEYTFNLNGREIKGKYLLYGWAKNYLVNKKMLPNFINPDNDLEIALDETENIEQEVIFHGKFKLDHIQKEVLNFSANQNLKTKIDRHSSQLLLEAYRQYEDILNNNSRELFYTIPIKDFNCEKPHEFTEEKFITALICRRLFIGLCKLRDEKIIEGEEIVKYSVWALKRQGQSLESLRQYLNLLGLSGETTNHPQSIRYDFPHIMREEERWLKICIPELIAKINRNDLSDF